MADENIKITLTEPGPAGSTGPQGPAGPSGGGVISSETAPTGQSDGALWYQPSSGDTHSLRQGNWTKVADDYRLADANGNIDLDGGAF